MYVYFQEDDPCLTNPWNVQTSRTDTVYMWLSDRLYRLTLWYRYT